ncbi:glutathione S-transferase [Psychrobacter sp. I-STPA6b]|uniref:glutathione S-transferase n=1 Tax=Psychrobacter sp. I-STPA6b TaxID=2585718 RepID=UPI001D0C3137|nr:glutathione S-transferase [Psychrobacter sp. I-STPA6b]
MSQLHLHHLENSRSFRILWLLEELELDYQLTKYERTAAYLAPESLEKIDPTGKAPILEVDGVSMIESGHIIDYLMAKYDTEYQLHPKTDADSLVWQDYDFWMHYAEGSIMPSLVMRLVFHKIAEKAPVLIRTITRGIRKQVEANLIAKNINTALDLVEKQLSNTQWFAGSEFSAADVQMGFVIEAANAGHALDKSKYANTLNWLKRCQARPAYQRAVEKGGKLNF